MATLVGRVGIVAKGAWDSSVAYDTLDMVTYNNSTYIAKQATAAGTLPTNTTYWQLALDADPLQPKTMSSPVTIGGESKTTVEEAIGALEDVKANRSDLTSIIATGSTNTTGAIITKNTYFYLNGELAKAKTDIASGATFTNGTNYENITAGGLNKLQATSSIGSRLEYMDISNGATLTLPSTYVAIVYFARDNHYSFAVVDYDDNVNYLHQDNNIVVTCTNHVISIKNTVGYAVHGFVIAKV